jgi:hypothetical protein
MKMHTRKMITITAFIAFIIVSIKNCYGQVPIDTTLPGPVIVSVKHPDFIRPANIWFNVQYSKGKFVMTDSVTTEPWSIFSKRDSLRANAFWPNKPDSVSGWSSWTRIVLVGAKPVANQIPFSYSADTWFEDYLAKSITAINSKAPPGYSGANAIVYLFGSQHPADTVGFYFDKTVDHVGKVTVSVNGNLTECNVQVANVTQKLTFKQWYTDQSATFNVARGVNRFRFWTKGVNCQMKSISVRWSDQTTPVSPLGVGVHR